MPDPSEYEDTIVINDLLSFMVCKVPVLSESNLLYCLRNFYSKREIDEAVNTFYSSVPTEKLEIYQSQYKDDSLSVLYNFFKNSDSSHLPIFVCKNLNNIPKLDSQGKFSSNSIEEDKDLISEQNFIKSQISEITSLVYQLKDQITVLTKNKGGQTSKNNKQRGLAYLQRLIDEEKREQKTHDAHKDIFDDFDEPLEEEEEEEEEDEEYEEEEDEEESLHLKANRVQRSLVKNVESVSLKRKKVALQPSSPPPTSDSEPEPILKRKIIHIKNKDVGPSDNVGECSELTDSPERRPLTKRHSNEEDSPGVFPRSESHEDERLPFIVVERVFDENVGHFSIYKCSLCNFSTNDASAVQQHDCPQIYSEDPLDRHDDGETKSFRYFCLHCRFRCTSKSLFKKHSQIHPQPYPCPFCREKLLETEQWTDHVMSCINNGGRNPEDHVCQICGVVYANANALTVHKGFHDPAKPFECLKCRYRFYTQETLDRHFKSHIINGFKCPFCHFVNKNKTTLGTHLRCHTGEMPFACQYCDYRSSSQSALTSHSFCHTNEKPVKCDECSAYFKSLHKLNSHKITHLKNRMHKCPVCGKGFKTGWLMTIHHQRIHLNLRPYPCEHCNYKARSLSALKSHHSTHLNEKLFKCFQCDFRANHKAYLKRHVNTWHVKRENE